MFDNVYGLSLEKQYDADGRVFLRCYYGAAGTKNTPMAVILGVNGPTAAALADNIAHYWVGVPDKDYAQYAEGRIQIGGRVAAMVTPSLSVAAGDALSILDGAVADAGVAYTGLAGQFACNITATTAATTHNCYLVGERIVATT